MQASTDFKWYLLTLISFIGTFCCSLLFIIWVLAMAFTTDSNNGEKKFTHPILTAVQFFLVTAFITLSNVLALKFFYGADAKMRAFCNRARPEKRSTQLLKTVVSIIFIICLYMGARRVVHSLFSDVVYSSSKSGHVHYYLPNPVEHFWQALTTYLFYFTPTVLILNSLMGLDQNVNAVVPYSLKFINSMMVLFGKISLFGWSLAYIFAIVLNSPFYNAVPMVALLITLIELSVWCEISSMLKLTPYQRLMSFLEFLKQVMIFLTRLSQVVLVFLPLDGFDAIQKHLIYLVLLFLFGNYDFIGSLFRCGSCCRGEEEPQQRTWIQFFRAGVFQIIHALLTVYRTIWVFILIVPGLHTTAMQYTPGRLALQIFSVWNLLVFLAEGLLMKMKAAAARRALDSNFAIQHTVAVSSATGNGYMPLSRDESCPSDVEMCIPSAVITDSSVVGHDEEKKQVLGDAVSPVNLL